MNLFPLPELRRCLKSICIDVSKSVKVQYDKTISGHVCSDNGRVDIMAILYN